MTTDQVYFLRSNLPDGSSPWNTEFKWNLEIGGITKAENIDHLDRNMVGKGLYGFCNGQGLGVLSQIYKIDLIWMVVKPIGEVIRNSCEAKCLEAQTMYVGDLNGAIEYLNKALNIPNNKTKVIAGKAISHGDCTTAEATGDRGTAIAIGDYCEAIATGNEGRAMVYGKKGRAVAGYNGLIMFAWQDEITGNEFTKWGRIGENGLFAYVYYELDDENNFIDTGIREYHPLMVENQGKYYVPDSERVHPSENLDFRQWYISWGDDGKCVLHTKDQEDVKLIPAGRNRITTEVFSPATKEDEETLEAMGRKVHRFKLDPVTGLFI